MSDQSRIEWTDATWNPVTGCTLVSPGCTNCYARRMASRLRGRFGYPARNPFKVTLHENRLNEPLRWRKPRLIFVSSMGDLFHKEVSDKFIDKVFAVTQMTPQHSYLILTKRAPRMLRYGTTPNRAAYVSNAGALELRRFTPRFDWPPWNVGFGVSAENQECFNERAPYLDKTPAAMRFVSLEPLLGPIEIPPDVLAWLNWVIAGGETGSGARPTNPNWVRSIRDQCVAAGVPFFLKSLGQGKGRILDGRTWDEMPEFV